MYVQSKRLRFYLCVFALPLALYLTFIVTFIALPNFAAPLDAQQVRFGISNYLASEMPDKSIRKIVEQRGGYAGDIGFFFVQLEPNGALIVPADMRFGVQKLNLKEGEDNHFLTFYKKNMRGRTIHYFKYTTSSKMKIEGLRNWFLRRKNTNQQFWMAQLANYPGPQ
jgi:hypothetical protein